MKGASLVDGASASSAGTPRAVNTRKRKGDTLAVFMQGMVGKQVLVELKNDTEVRGFIQDADDAMNLVMQDVTCVNNQGVSQALAMLYVSGRMVRYVHISQHVDVARTIQRHIDSMDASARRAKRPHMKAPSTPLQPSAPIIVTAAAVNEDEDSEDDGLGGDWVN